MHVQHAEGEAKFWIEPIVDLHANYGMKDKQLSEARKLVEEHLDESALPGQGTSPAEVTNVSPHGFWLFVHDQELFVPFRDFPWFKNASIQQISRVELPSAHHLYWPELDIDLAVESLTHPERYPLVSHVEPDRRPRPTKAKRRSVKKRPGRLRVRS